MKPFKLVKNRGHRQPLYVVAPLVTSYPKPKLPLRFFKIVHPPIRFNDQGPQGEGEVGEVVEVVEVEVVVPLEREVVLERQQEEE